MATPPAVLWWGEGRGAAGPRYWASADVATDDGQTVAFVLETNPLAPAGLSGECAFVNAYVTVTAAAGAELRVTAIVDDNEPAAVTTPNSGSLNVTRVSFAIPQVTGIPPLAAQTRTVQVPLLRSLSRGGAAIARWYVRGARVAIRVESVGTIGTGVFRIDGIDIEYDTIRTPANGTVTVGT